MLGEKPENAIVRPSRRKDGKIIIIKILTRHSDHFHVSLVSDVTEEYRIRRALEMNEQRISEAQRIGRFGWWEYRPETNMYIGSEEISRIFNDEVSNLSFTYQDNISYTHPEDRSYRYLSHRGGDGEEEGVLLHNIQDHHPEGKCQKPSTSTPTSSMMRTAGCFTVTGHARISPRRRGSWTT
ncbi:MAG: hypothetical protein MZV63_12555 [Marinilabiliales bacterium]|nr:hypothetical protein [Marinilabiliales bacterium]